jgi:hypothetical protein
VTGYPATSLTVKGCHTQLAAFSRARIANVGRDGTLSLTTESLSPFPISAMWQPSVAAFPLAGCPGQRLPSLPSLCAHGRVMARRAIKSCATLNRGTHLARAQLFTSPYPIGGYSRAGDLRVGNRVVLAFVRAQVSQGGFQKQKVGGGAPMADTPDRRGGIAPVNVRLLALTPRPRRRRVAPGAIRVPSQPSEDHG